MLGESGFRVEIRDWGGLSWVWTIRKTAEKSLAVGIGMSMSLFFPKEELFKRTMAKTCWIERQKRKQKTVNKYAALRAELKKNHDYVGLSMLPRNASPTRLTNRCQLTGRRRGYIGRFKLSRISFRELANGGMIPGVTKSSW